MYIPRSHAGMDGCCCRGLGLAESMENAILDRVGILLLRSAALHSDQLSACLNAEAVAEVGGGRGASRDGR